MTYFADLAHHVDVLCSAIGDDATVSDLPRLVERMSDDDVVAVISATTSLARAAEMLRIAATGVAAARSTRDAGHDGLAQRRGFRSPAAMIQDLTGSTMSDATRSVRLGEALRAGAFTGDVDVDDFGAATTEAPDDDTDVATAPTPGAPWHAPLSRALLAGTISAAQHDAVMRGLGEPTDDARDAWSVAAEHLIAEAGQRTVEELARTARTLRDQLDPEGGQRRFDEQFERRSFRTWTDADGVRRGSMIFDPHGGAWVQSILDAALRPRRGGPRFVDADEKATAETLAADPRSNDQLAYDLMLDVLRAGAIADAETVFGTRQAGVRVVITASALSSGRAGGAAFGLVEDDQTTLPAWLVAQQACDTGTRDCTLDVAGNPLDLGREARLFTPAQKIALAIRDGGCRWTGCDRPASYCEAHHVDEWAKDGGCTDVDRGILLCRYHHMALHHGGWRITRDGRDDFLLHPPGGARPVVLRPRLALRYAWGDIDPPPGRFRAAA